MKILLTFLSFFIFSFTFENQEITISELTEIFELKNKKDFIEKIENKGFNYTREKETNDCMVYIFNSNEGNFMLKFLCNDGNGSVTYSSKFGDLNFQSYIKDSENLGYKVYEKDEIDGEKFINLKKGNKVISIVLLKDEDEGEYFQVWLSNSPYLTKK